MMIKKIGTTPMEMIMQKQTDESLVTIRYGMGILKGEKCKGNPMRGNEMGRRFDR